MCVGCGHTHIYTHTCLLTHTVDAPCILELVAPPERRQGLSRVRAVVLRKLVRDRLG